MDKQAFEVPNTKSKGCTGAYRISKHPELLSFLDKDTHSVYGLFSHGLSVGRDRPCLGYRPLNTQTGEHEPYVWQSYGQVEERITNFGSGLLHTINHTLGNPKTEKIPVGIWAPNRPEWTITDLACNAYSLYSVALYDTFGPDAIEYIVEHSEIETIVSTIDHVADILKLKKKLPKLKIIISMDSLNTAKQCTGPAGASVLGDWAKECGVILLDYDHVEKLGAVHPRKHNYLSILDLATIMYTSGTTDKPKGAMLSNLNFICTTVGAITQFNYIGEDVYFSYLPLAHIFDRAMLFSVLYKGGKIAYYSGNTENLMKDLQFARPTIFISVPRLLNRIYNNIVQVTVNAPGVKGEMSRMAVASKLKLLNEGKGYHHDVWDELLFNKIKPILGGNVRLVITGSAPIDKDILQFLRISLLVTIVQGYGTTETTAAASCQIMHEHKSGDVGPPFPGNEIKLVDVPEMNYLSTNTPYPSGEVWVRGSNIFMGYYKDVEKTREVLDKEGWYSTGDIGHFDERGCLHIVDRKKNIFKLAQGEYVIPEKIENTYCRDPLVAQIFVHGDSLERYLVAIIVPDPDILNIVAQQVVKDTTLNYEQQCRHPAIHAEVMKRLTQLGKTSGLRGFELVRSVYLESVPFTSERILTPTFKLKRHEAKIFYRVQITKMYSDLSNAVDTTAFKL
ncbi:hypothetical protein BDF14DRAFT_1827145 [Spinellus fusiger]|nr:hypothetical protein BDF14DRAFT_1827145 [Spinellus fusiger]